MDLELEMRKLAFQREQVKREREQQFELELAAKRTKSPSIAPSFDITKHVRMVPPFSEREVDRYFPYFERVATTLKWPKETWTLLLQSVLVGRARDVYVSLPIEQSLLYETVKSEILRRYELVPEAYRQRFRYCKKTDRHTYVEFAHEKKYHMEKDAMLQKQAADYSSLKTEFEQNKDYASKLQSECSCLKQILDEKVEMLTTMTRECQSHTEELHKRNESVVSLGNQMDTVSGNNVKLESDNVSLKSSLDIYVTDNSNLKKVVAQRHAEVEVLTTSLLMLFLELK